MQCLAYSTQPSCSLTHTDQLSKLLNRHGLHASCSTTGDGTTSACKAHWSSMASIISNESMTNTAMLPAMQCSVIQPGDCSASYDQMTSWCDSVAKSSASFYPARASQRPALQRTTSGEALPTRRRPGCCCSTRVVKPALSKSHRRLNTAVFVVASGDLSVCLADGARLEHMVIAISLATACACIATIKRRNAVVPGYHSALSINPTGKLQ